MKKIFLETSFFIRYFTADNPKKFKDCLKLLEYVENGSLRPYSSNIVIFEIFFVLTRIYKFSTSEVVDSIKKIIAIRNLTLIETTNTKDALKLHEKYQVKYPDCLIATQVPQGAKLVTYDEDFSKIGTLLPTTPADLL